MSGFPDWDHAQEKPSREARSRMARGKSQGWCPFCLFAAPASPSQTKRMRNADRRMVQSAVPLARQRIQRDAHACRRSTTVLAKGTLVSVCLSVRPGFLGRGVRAGVTRSACPSPGSTSRPGHSAGRLMPDAARERLATPPAGTALAPMARRASGPRPSRGHVGEIRRTLVPLFETFVKDTLRYPRRVPGVVAGHALLFARNLAKRITQREVTDSHRTLGVNENSRMIIFDLIVCRTRISLSAAPRCCGREAALLRPPSQTLSNTHPIKGWVSKLFEFRVARRGNGFFIALCS